MAKRLSDYFPPGKPALPSKNYDYHKMKTGYPKHMIDSTFDPNKKDPIKTKWYDAEKNYNNGGGLNRPINKMAADFERPVILSAKSKRIEDVKKKGYNNIPKPKKKINYKKYKTDPLDY